MPPMGVGVTGVPNPLTTGRGRHQSNDSGRAGAARKRRQETRSHL